MRVMIDFFRAMLLLPKPWVVWVGLLIAANLVAPLFFIGSLEAKVVVVAIMVGAITQMAIFRAKGFVRLLGLGHFPWVLMIPWLWSRLGQLEVNNTFAYWLVAVIVLDGLSLIIDVTDVARYIKGERAPQLRLVD